MTVGQLLLNKSRYEDLQKLQEAIDAETESRKNRSLFSTIGQIALPIVANLLVPGAGAALTPLQKAAAVTALSYAGSEAGEAVANVTDKSQKIEDIEKGLRFGRNQATEAIESFEDYDKDFQTSQYLSSIGKGLQVGGVDLLKDLPLGLDTGFFAPAETATTDVNMDIGLSNLLDEEFDLSDIFGEEDYESLDLFKQGGD